MKQAEFSQLVKRLDGGYPPAADPEGRLDALWSVVKDFEAQVFESAVQNLIESCTYMANPHDVYEACLEAKSELQSDGKPRRRKPMAVHRCTEAKPQESEGLRWLRIIAPYEAAHILCDPKVKATCPECGKHHSPKPTVIEAIREKYPEGSEKWTPNMKGFCICADCAKP